MDNIRFLPTSLDIYFEEVRNNNKGMFKQEYDYLCDFETDMVGQWLKNAKARGDTKETDDVLLTLLVELHKKIDHLEFIIKNEEYKYLQLINDCKLTGINFDYIKISTNQLEPQKHYYCRIPLPIFPKREVPLFIQATTPSSAKISTISQINQQDWNNYITSREREIIRQTKRNA